MFNYKKAQTFESRRNESSKVRQKYPDKIPVIVEKQVKTNLPDIDKHKFLVPSDLTVGQFVYVIRKRIKLKPEQALFIFINNTLCPTSHLMSEMYRNHKDEDGFLYIIYDTENVYG